MLCFSIAASISQAQGALVPITADNIAQVKPFASFVGELGAYGNDVLFSSDGTRVVSVLSSASLANARTGDQLSFSGQGKPAAFSADRRLLFLSDEDHTRVWDIDQDEERFNVADGFVELSPNDKWLLTGHDPRWETEMQLWEVSTGRHITALNREYNTFIPAFSPDGKYLAWRSYHADETILWDTGAKATHLKLPVGAIGGAFTPDGSTFVTVSEKDVQLWNVGDGSLQRTIALAGGRAVTISPDGALMAIYDDDDYREGLPDIFLVSSATGKRIAQLKNKHGLNTVRFSPDSKMMLFGNLYGQVRAWDIRKQTEARIPAELAEINLDNVTFSPDGQLLLGETLTYDYQPLTQVWETTTWKRRTTLNGSGFTFSPDMTTLAHTVRGVLVLYGINRPAHTVMLAGHIVPEAVNMRAAPSAQAKISGKVGGTVLASGQNNGFVYLASHDGWVRADPQYFVLEDGLPLAFLAPLDSSQAVAFKGTLTPTPTVPTCTPTNTPTPLAATPTLALPPKVIATVTPVSRGQGDTVPIMPGNADQVRLLGVLKYQKEYTYFKYFDDFDLMGGGAKANSLSATTARQL
jgi:WD40 repeat protein